MAYTAAAMFGAAAFIGLISGLVPGDPRYPIAPILAALVFAILILGAGPRLPRWGLALLGPIGVTLIASVLAKLPAATDDAVLYVWPVLWTTFFFGRRGAIAIVAYVGVAHGVALLSLPAASSYVGRWIDVVISASVVAAVVQLLAQRNGELLARLSGEARTDKLTGLLNRRGFDERASIELAHSMRDHHPIAVAAFDVDHFKHINDEWGHVTGDLVLAHMGAALAAHSRDIDVAARVGGDEFVVLLPGGSSADANTFTQRIRLALSARDPSSGLPTVRVSAGVAAEDAPTDIKPLLLRADAALYTAKRAGRDQTTTLGREKAPSAPGPTVELLSL